jgi:hypothetical protein
MNLRWLVVLGLCACGVMPAPASQGGGESTSTGAGGGAASSGGGSASSGGGSASSGGGTAGTGGGTRSSATGLAGFCQHYFDCGGSSYASVQDCIDQSYGYWGSCPTRKAALDAYGDCMDAVSCADWGDPSAYLPSAGPCAQKWANLENSQPCP